MIYFLVVVHGKVYDIRYVVDHYPCLRGVDLFDPKFTKVFAEDLEEAQRIKARIPKDDQGQHGIHRRKEKLSYRSYYDVEDVYIFVDDVMYIPNLK